MAITNRPADGYIDDLTAPAPAGDGVGGGTAWFAQLQAFVKQLWGVLFEAEATLASDTFSPTQAAYSLIPQSGTTDNLASIGAGFDGMVLRIRPKTGNTITVKNAQGGAGQILIADAADFVMSDPTMRLVLVYSASATAWIEEDRMYGANKTAFTAWLNAATSSLAGIIKAASIATTRTGTATDTAVTPDALATLWQKGADVASATTLTKPSDADLGGYHVITGTTAVTTMWAGVTAGEEYEFEAAAALPLTHGSNLVLLTGANITCAAGDRFRLRYFGSSVWKMVSFQRQNGAPLASVGGYVSTSSNYGITAADNGKLIEFTGSGGITASWAAASGLAGVRVTLKNSTSGDVTLDPNASEQLDGQTTRKLRPGDRVSIACSGTGHVTVEGEYSYDSADQTITTGGALTLAHGLGVRPTRIEIELFNSGTSEAGFTGGTDRPVIPISGIQNGTSNQFMVITDGTNIKVQFGSVAIAIVHKTTGVLTTLTPANWKIRFRAFAK